MKSGEDLEGRVAALERRLLPPHAAHEVNSGEGLEVLIAGILRASEALNIDMGDGEPTFQCCNTVCGHHRCKFGDAFHLLVEKGLIDWDRKASKWVRSRPRRLPPSDE